MQIIKTRAVVSRFGDKKPHSDWGRIGVLLVDVKYNKSTGECESISYGNSPSEMKEIAAVSPHTGCRIQPVDLEEYLPQARQIKKSDPAHKQLLEYAKRKGIECTEIDLIDFINILGWESKLAA